MTKPTVQVPPNSVTCLHGGAMSFGGTCFANDVALAHVECAEAQASAEHPFAYAAICYVVESFMPGHDPEAWPWDPAWWTPFENPVVNLRTAISLIAAEIDRLCAAPAVSPEEPL